MTGKIFGIPLALILLVFFIALLVNIPMMMFHTENLKRMNTIEKKIDAMNKVEVVVPTVVPTVTEEPTPTEKVRMPISVPSTTSGAIK